MRIQNPKRTLFIGMIVWLLFFGWWFRGFLFRNWQFRLFSFSSWRHLMTEFRSGWHISSKSDWIFIFSFIVSPFVFGLLWYLAQKVQWRKLWKKIWKALRWPFLRKRKKKLDEAVAAYTPKQAIVAPSVYRPQAMPSTGAKLQSAPVSQKSFLNNSTAMGNFSSSASEGSMADFQSFSDFSSTPSPSVEQPIHPTLTNDDFAKMADTPLSEIKIPEMEPVKEDISSLLEQAGYTLLPISELSGQKVDLLAASAQDLLIIRYDEEKGDWLADEESFNEEDPLWFSETDHRISPVFQLKQMANTLQQKLGDTLVVQPVLIEKEGTIINAEDMMKTWNDMGITVCRTGVGGPVELPTGTEIFKEPQEKISAESLEKIKSIL